MIYENLKVWNLNAKGKRTGNVTRQQLRMSSGARAMTQQAIDKEQEEFINAEVK